MLLQSQGSEKQNERRDAHRDPCDLPVQLCVLDYDHLRVVLATCEPRAECKAGSAQSRLASGDNGGGPIAVSRSLRRVSEHGLLLACISIGHWLGSPTAAVRWDDYAHGQCE